MRSVGFGTRNSLKCFSCSEGHIYLSNCFYESDFMIRKSLFFCKFFYFERNGTDTITRNARKEMVFDLFIESTKNLMDTFSTKYISGCTSLEVYPCILTYFLSIDYFHTDMIYHKHKCQMRTDKETDKNPSNKSPKETKNKNKWRWKNTYISERKKYLTIFSMLYNVYPRTNNEIEIHKRSNTPKQESFVSMKYRELPRISCKYLIIVANIGIMDIWIGEGMMSDIVFFCPPWVRYSDEEICRDRCDPFTHFRTTKVLMMEYVVRDKSEFYCENKEIKYRPDESHFREKYETRDIENDNDSYTDASLHWGCSIEFLFYDSRF